MEYVALRQKEGAFRKGDPGVVVMFALGSIVHYAMGQYLFAGKKRCLADEAVIEELIALVMGGIMKRGAKAAAPKIGNGRI
jgi:hypothetical protein